MNKEAILLVIIIMLILIIIKILPKDASQEIGVASTVRRRYLTGNISIIYNIFLKYTRNLTEI